MQDKNTTLDRLLDEAASDQSPLTRIRTSQDIADLRERLFVRLPSVRMTRLTYYIIGNGKLRVATRGR